MNRETLLRSFTLPPASRCRTPRWLVAAIIVAVIALLPMQAFSAGCGCAGGGVKVKLVVSHKGPGSATANVNGGHPTTVTGGEKGASAESGTFTLQPGSQNITITLEGIDSSENCNKSFGGAYVVTLCGQVLGGASVESHYEIGIIDHCDPCGEYGEGGEGFSDEGEGGGGGGSPPTEPGCYVNETLTQTKSFKVIPPGDGTDEGKDKGEGEGGGGPGGPAQVAMPDGMDDPALFNQTFSLGLDANFSNAGYLHVTTNLALADPFAALAGALYPSYGSLGTTQFSNTIIFYPSLTTASHSRQVKTRNRLLVLKKVESGNRIMTLSYYRPEQVANWNANRGPYLIQSDQQPYAHYEIKPAPAKDGYHQGLQTLALVNGVSSTSEHYAAVAAGGLMIWSAKDDLAIESKLELVAQGSQVRATTEELVRQIAPGGQINWVHRSLETELRKNFMWGIEVINRTIEINNVLAVSDEFQFQDNPLQEGYGNLKKVTHLNGSWEKYTFGREVDIQTPPPTVTTWTKKFTPWIGQRTGAGAVTGVSDVNAADETNCRVETKSEVATYLNPYLPETKTIVEEKILGIVTMVTETSSQNNVSSGGKSGSEYLTVIRPDGRSTDPIVTRRVSSAAPAYMPSSVREIGPSFSFTWLPDGSMERIETQTWGKASGVGEKDQPDMRVRRTTRIPVPQGGGETPQLVTREEHLQGDLLMREATLISTGAGYEPMTATIYQYDDRKRLTAVFKDGFPWRNYQYLPTDGQDQATHEVETDERGIVTETIVLVNGDSKTIRRGVPDDTEHGLQYDIETMETTQEVTEGTKTRTTVKAGEGEAAIETTSYTISDPLGRVIEEMDVQGGKTRYAYSVAGTGETRTTFLPGHGENASRQIISVSNIDGRLHSLTGEATTSEFYQYSITQAGGKSRLETKRRVGSADSLRFWITITDSLGQIISETGENHTITNHAYHAVTGQRLSTQVPGRAIQLFEYDGRGQLKAQGYDMNGNGKLDRISKDRLTEIVRRFEKINGSWWHAEIRKNFVEDDSDRILSTAVWRRLNLGAGPTASNTTVLVSQMQSVAEDGIETNLSVVADRQARRTVFTTLSSAHPGRESERVELNGSTISESTFAVATPTVMRYDAFARLIQQVDPRANAGAVTAYLPDGRTSSVTETDTFAASPAATFITTYQYYGAEEFGSGALPGKLKAIIRPGGAAERYGYDALGRITHQWGSGTYPVRWEYDPAVGDLVKMHSYRFEGSGLGWSSGDLPGGFDQAGDQTTWSYAPATGLLTGKTDALNHGVTYGYNANGMLATRTWARSVTTTYGYTTAGEVTSVVYSDGTPAVTILYDRAGRPHQRTDAAGVTASTYDGPGGRLTQMTFGAAALPISRDQPAPPPGVPVGAAGPAPTLPSRNNLLSGLGISYAYGSSASRKKVGYSATFGGNVLTHVGYGYEPSTGRLQTVSLGQDFASYEYVSNSDLIWRTTAGAVVGTRTYSSAGRMEGITWTSGGATVLSNVYGFNSTGRRAASIREDGTKFAYTYNDRGEVTEGQRLKSNGEEMVGWHFGYQYDAIGNRKEFSTAGANYPWTADAGNRLTDRQNPLTQYVLGRADPGATVTVVQNGTAIDTAGRDGADFHAVATRSDGWEALAVTAAKDGITTQRTGNLAMPPAEEALGYDDDGNLTSDWRWTYEWDGENRLKAITPTPAAIAAGVPKQRIEYGYDGQGRRIQKLVLEWQGEPDYFWEVAEDRRFIYDGWNLMAEVVIMTNGGAVDTRFVYAWGLDSSGSEQGAGGVSGLLLAKSFSATSGGASTATLTPAYDGNGNVLAYLRPATAAVAARYEYDPFGRTVLSEEAETYTRTETGSRVVAKEIPPFRFATKCIDRETGVLYFGYRYYSGELGRWLSADPIGEAGGANCHQMLGNDPVNEIDLLGLAAVDPRLIDSSGKCRKFCDKWCANSERKLQKFKWRWRTLHRVTYVQEEYTCCCLCDTGHCKVGPFAGESVSATGPKTTEKQRDQLKVISQKTGCHSCGTKTGRFHGDHQPPTGLNPPGGAQQLYPQCETCSNKQSFEVQMIRRYEECHGEEFPGVEPPPPPSFLDQILNFFK